MELKRIQNKEDWEGFYREIKIEHKTFLNSWNWGEFYQSLDSKIYRLGIYEGQKLLSVCLVIKKESESKWKAKIGSHLFIPHGPTILDKFKEKKERILNIYLKELKNIAKKENSNFIRLAPIFDRNEKNKKIFKNLGFKPSPVFIHPEISWVLNIEKDIDELLADMRKTTRYMIRQGIKNEVEFIKSNDINEYNDLYLQTVKRQGFTPFTMRYLENELESFGDEIELYFVKYKDHIESGAMIIYWQGQAFYHQGASDLKYSKVGGSYFLQYKIIEEAKKRGIKMYNFWGIVDEIKEKKDLKNTRNHPWWGLSLFKMGFGGKRIEYLKTYDYPLTPLYYLFAVYEKLRRLKKGI